MSSSASAPKGTSASSSGGGGKKRRRDEQRERLQRCGVEVPDIPGLPVPLIPVHVHALQVTTKFFQLETDQVIDPYTAHHGSRRTGPDGTDGGAPFAEESQQQRQLPPQNIRAFASANASVMESILNRVDASQSVALEASDEQRKRRERRRAMEDAVTGWLQAVHRHMRDAQHHPKSDSAKAMTSSVAVCALEHLWELQLEHERIPVKRACLHLSAQLLLKSAECRQWLLDPTYASASSSSSSALPLMAWMDHVAQVVAEVTRAASQVPRERARSSRFSCWQQESFRLLEQLNRRGYGSLYPTLAAALLRFRQQHALGIHEAAALGAAAEASSVPPPVPHDMPVLRLWRDQAMDHYPKEAKVIHKLIERAHQWMDVIVPRMGEAPESSSANATADVEDEGDGDDEDVDWEDGWEEGAMSTDESEEARHASAVERTLATMAASGSLREGELTVELGVADDASAAESTPDPAKTEAMRQLATLVERLSSRHLPRLTTWTDGLTRADGLVNSKSGGALVTLPLRSSHRRKEALDVVVRLRSKVASVLSSAKRLGLLGPPDQLAPSSVTNREALLRRQQHPSVRLAGMSRHISLSSKLDKRGFSGPSSDATRSRSNRIQIKYRKN